MFDWNQIEQAKSLGAAKIDLEGLEPFQGAEHDVKLIHNKHGEKGFVRVNLMFRPEIIVKARKNTSTFSTAGRAFTQVGHLPVGAGKGVVHGITGVAAGILRRGGGGSDSDDDKSLKEIPAGQASQQVGTNGLMPASSTFSAYNGEATANGAVTQPGTLRVTVIEAKDVSTGDVKPYAVVRVGDKEFKTKHIKSQAPEWYVYAIVVLEIF